MKSIMIIILGLALLVSAAAAGNFNIANVDVTDNMAGQIMTNAYFVQASDIEADLDGNSIQADQITNIEAVDNILTGSKQDGNTFFCQSVDHLINDTGNNNADTQIIGAPGTGTGSFDSGLIAVGNTLTDSASSQMIRQNEIVEGNSNNAIQNVGVPGDISVSDIVTGDGSFDSGLIAVGNTLTDSASSQMIRQKEIVEGNSNSDTQNVGVPDLIFVFGPAVTGDGSFDSGLIAVGNTLTDSASSQMISQNEIVEGNCNNATQNVGVPGFIDVFASTVIGDGSFDSGLIAVGNTLTDSVSNQMISQNEIVEGNCNNATQNVGVPGDIGNTGGRVIGDGSFDSGLIAIGNTLTDSALSQMINQYEIVEGNSNSDTQKVGVPGHIVVDDSTVIGDGILDSGLIAVGNTLTDSASSQMIRQKEIVEGNSNSDTQNVGVPGEIEVFVYRSTVTGDGSFDSGLISVGNTLTDSASSQMISQKEIIEGNCNNAIQNVGVPGIIEAAEGSIVTGDGFFDSGLIAVGNTLTGSGTSQMISQKEIVEGNGNNAIQNVGVPGDIAFFGNMNGDGSFDSGLIAVGNTLTDSASSQMIRQNEIIEGNCNEATQIANSVMTTDILTRSHALQIIDEGALTVGSFNTIFHNGNLTSTANTVTDGSILQHADIFSSS
jgi:hypothetical protein